MSALDLVILVFGAYRFWMLLAKDAITQPWRQRLLGYNDDGSRNRWRTPGSGRKTLAEFVHCPWCLGFWLSLAAVAAYHEWPHATRWILLPFAVSALVALAAVTFDRVVLDKR